MKFHIPWIITRRRFFIAILIDGFITSFFYSKSYFIQFMAFPNPLVTISLSSFWIVLSYVLGRYMICKKINFSEILKTIFKSIFVFASCNFIYLIINWSNKILNLFFINKVEEIYIQKDQSILFIKATLIISIVSCVLQYIISIVTHQLYVNKKLWIFYGGQKGFEDLKKEINIHYKNFDLQRVGYSDDVNKIKVENIEGIILDKNKETNKYNFDQIFFFKSKGIKIFNTLKWCENELHRIPPFFIENKYQIIEKFNLLDNSYKIRVKRFGDFIVSLFLLIITSPIFLLISILIYLEDHGPILYSQLRTGFRGKEITIYKFRSMIKDAEKHGPQWCDIEDKRITKVGRIIRALRLDELPQLYSVLGGSMSLIGPRPERPRIENDLLNEIPYYKYRNLLKPGISGWAQVNYNYGASKEDTINKLSFDLYYINHISFFLDLLILFKTIKIVFNSNSHNPKSTAKFNQI